MLQRQFSPSICQLFGRPTVISVSCRVLFSTRHIPATEEEARHGQRDQVSSPPGAKTLKVAILGSPNAGKSTLLNQLIGWRVAAVSSKVHTTRRKTLAMLTENDSQIVFLDTPGLITHATRKKHKLEKSLLVDPHAALCDADLIVSLVDISKPWNQSRLDAEMLKALYVHRHKQSVLVLNKIDLVSDKRALLQCIRLLTEEQVLNGRAGIITDHHNKLLPRLTADKTAATSSSRRSVEKTTRQPGNDTSQVGVGEDESVVAEARASQWGEYEHLMQLASRETRDLKGWAHFDRVFLISALNDDGVADVRDYLLSKAQPGQWRYDAGEVTREKPSDLAEMCIREHMLELLPEEIPYVVNIKRTLWEVDENGLLHARFNLVCLRKRHFQFLLGRGGETVKLIAEKAKQSLMNTFRREMTLFLNVCMPGDQQQR